MAEESARPRSFRERVYVVVFGFAAVDVAFMLAVATSMLGPIPWAVYSLLAAASFTAIFAGPVFWALTRGWGLKLVDLLAWEAALIALARFNYWCPASALAEVWRDARNKLAATACSKAAASCFGVVDPSLWVNCYPTRLPCGPCP